MMPTLYERLYLLSLKDNATETYTKKIWRSKPDEMGFTAPYIFLSCLNVLFVLLRIGVELRVALYADIGEAVDGDDYGDILVGAGVAHAGGKAESLTVDAVEHQAFKYPGLAVVVVETRVKRRLGETVLEECRTVLSGDDKRYGVVNIRLSRLILHQGKTVVGCAVNDTRQMAVAKVSLRFLVVVLHPYGCRRLFLHFFLDYDVCTLFRFLAGYESHGSGNTRQNNCFFHSCQFLINLCKGTVFFLCDKKKHEKQMFFNVRPMKYTKMYLDVRKSKYDHPANK